MNWLRNVAAVAALIVGVGIGCGWAQEYTVDSVDPVTPTQDLNAAASTSTADALYLGVSGSNSRDKWKDTTIVIKNSAVNGFVTIGKKSSADAGFSGTIDVGNIIFDSTITAATTLRIQGATATQGITLNANSLTVAQSGTVELYAGLAANKNRFNLNDLTMDTVLAAGTNTIKVNNNAELLVERNVNFGANNSIVLVDSGIATFSGSGTSNWGTNSQFNLTNGGTIDFQKGFAITGANNSINALGDTGSNISAVGDTGVIAGVSNAINLGATSATTLYIMNKVTDPVATYGTGQLRVTMHNAISMAHTGNSLHIGDYIIGSEVGKNGITSLYSGGGTGTVYAKTFTVESEAKASGSVNVATNIEGDTAIAGHYTLAAGADKNKFGGDTLVTGTLESTADTTISTGSGTNFTVDGGVLKNASTLTLTSGTNTSNLSFVRNAGTVQGQVTAENYALRIATDVAMTNGGIEAKTYVQEGGRVTGANSTIKTNDASSMTYIRNGAEFAVSGDFAGDVSFLGGSKLIAAGNTINSRKTGQGTMTIDANSEIDLTSGNLKFTGFKEINSKGYLHLGADVNSDKINTLDLGNGTMNIDHSKIQMNSDFVATYYKNRGPVTEGSLDARNLFITGGTVNNGVTGWTVSNAFGDFTFKNGATGSWVETYAKTDVNNTAAVETQLKKNWGPNVVSNSVAGATAMAARSMLGLPNGLITDGSPEGLDNLAMLQALASGTKGASFTLANGSAGTFDNGIMAGFNGAIASGPIYVAQDTFRDIATGLHSRLDAYRKVIECISVNPSPDAAIAAPAAYGSLGLASVDRYMNRFWAGGFGTWQKAKARNGFDGYKYDGAGVSLGYDRSFGPAVMGLGFTYVEGNYDDYSATSSDSKIKQYVANAYATVNASSGFFATAMTGFNYSENDLQDVRGGIMTDRDYHTLSFYAGGRLGYDIEPCDNLSISPSVGADFFWSRSGSYDVKFADGSQPWHYNKMKNHNIEIPVEVKVAYDINWGDNKTLTLMANGGYAYNLNDHGVWGNIDATGTDAPEIRAVGRKLGHHSWKGGAGIRFRMNNWDVGAKYDYQGRSNFNAHRLSAQVGYSF